MDSGECVERCPIGYFEYDFGANGVICVSDCLAISLAEEGSARFRATDSGGVRRCVVAADC